MLVYPAPPPHYSHDYPVYVVHASSLRSYTPLIGDASVDIKSCVRVVGKLHVLSRCFLKPTKLWHRIDLFHSFYMLLTSMLAYLTLCVWTESEMVLVACGAI